MATNLFDHVDCPAANVNILDGNAADLGAECARYEVRSPLWPATCCRSRPPLPSCRPPAPLPPIYRLPLTGSLQRDGSNHLGLWCNALPENKMALITSDSS